MLKVSCLSILLCGLLGSSTARLPFPFIPKGFGVGEFLPSLQKTDLQDSIKKFFSKSVSPLEFDVQLPNEDSKITVQVKDLQILQLSLKNLPDNKGAELSIPLEFSMLVKLLAFKPLKFHVLTDMKVQLHLEKNADGRLQLTFKDCRLVPETVWIQSESLDTPIKKFIGETIQRNFKILMTNNLGAKLCQFINSWLRTLNPHLANELLDLILQPGMYQLNI